MKAAEALVIVVATLAATCAAKVTPVKVKGNAFFAGDQRFYIRGVDYQPGGSAKAQDPIADAQGCKRDIAKFKELGLNTIRVYTVDNAVSHDECMNALADAGIYLALDVNSPKYSINRAKPAPSYNDLYLQNVFATIDAFAKYDNTLLYFSANEVINDNETTPAAKYVKAVTRDMRQYIKSRKYRQIPVGYSAADVENNRFEMAMYMNCGDDPDARSDFFAFNDYSWCDPSSFTTSGWDQKVEKYKDYSIPLFLSEYGCNINKRQFGAVKSLYSDDMSAVYSGGLLYEYSQEPSNYGLVEIDGNSVSELPDFQTFKQALAETKAPSGDGGFKENNPISKCPDRSETWALGASDTLPAIPDLAKAFMEKGAGKGVGLAGPGSQEGGSSGGGAGITAPGSGKPTSTPKPKPNAAVRGVKVMGAGMGSLMGVLVVLVWVAIGATVMLV